VEPPAPVDPVELPPVPLAPPPFAVPPPLPVALVVPASDPAFVSAMGAASVELPHAAAIDPSTSKRDGAKRE
jgi:hypothetical protein